LRKESINKLFNSAKSYMEKFVGMNYVFVYREKDSNLNYKEVMFPASAFKHLTGVKTNMNSEDFLDACINRKLPSAVISSRMDLAEIKLSILPTLLNTASYRYIGEFETSGVYIETEALTGNSFACLGIDKRDATNLQVADSIPDGVTGIFQ
jgi:hypothetical protein